METENTVGCWEQGDGDILLKRYRLWITRIINSVGLSVKNSKLVFIL
jgi:hypothetical protein